MTPKSKVLKRWPRAWCGWIYLSPAKTVFAVYRACCDGRRLATADTRQKAWAKAAANL